MSHSTSTNKNYRLIFPKNHNKIFSASKMSKAAKYFYEQLKKEGYEGDMFTVMNLSNNTVQNFQLTSQSRKNIEIKKYERKRIPELVNEIKKLQEEIKSLTKKNDLLKKEVDQLKKRPQIEHRNMGCSIQ